MKVIVPHGRAAVGTKDFLELSVAAAINLFGLESGAAIRHNGKAMGSGGHGAAT